MKARPVLQPLLVTADQAGVLLGFSRSQVLKFERQGLLTPVRVHGLRATRYDREQVEALARSWIAAAHGADGAA